MANLLDYISWRGDLPVCSAAPLNDLDALSFARFSYLPLGEAPLEDGDCIAQVWEKMKELPPESFRRQDRTLLEQMAESPRYRAMQVTDYEKINDPEEEKQFAAVTLQTGKDEITVSFCGTDSTVYGWKEDFNMSFMEEVPAQATALRYAGKVFARYPKKRVRLVGHSKGGNLAVYVYYMIPPADRRRVIHVKNFDGPGFHEELLEEVAERTIVNRIFSYLPADSVFGRILERREPEHIVLSEDHDLEQHDIYNWQVNRTGFVPAESFSDNSNITKTVIDKVMYQNTPSDRKKYIDTIYNVIASTSAETTAEFRQGFPQNIPTILRTLSELPQDDWKLLTQISREFGSAFATERAKVQGEKLSQAAEPLLRLLGGESRKTDEEEK